MTRMRMLIVVLLVIFGIIEACALHLWRTAAERMRWASLPVALYSTSFQSPEETSITGIRISGVPEGGRLRFLDEKGATVALSEGCRSLEGERYVVCRFPDRPKLMAGRWYEYHYEMGP
jgi:hypothetical protein